MGETSRAANFALQLKHVPSSGNTADAPSRALSDSDCSLSTVAWARVQSRFGPHTFDLMSLTATVAEAGMKISCLTTRLGRPLILQEQMSLHSRYLVSITSMFSPLSSLSDRSWRIALGSTPAFCLYHHCPWFLRGSASLLVGNSSSFSGRFYCSRKEGRSVRSTISFPLLPGFHRKSSAMGSMGFSLYLPWINCSFPAL